MAQCSGLLLSSTQAGTVTERLQCVHMQRAHIDRCCIVINSGHFVEYSWPSVLQGDGSGGGQGEKRERARASWRTVNPVVGPPRSPTSLPLLFHFKSTARENASFQYVNLREVTPEQCRKMHIYEVRVKDEDVLYMRGAHMKWMMKRGRKSQRSQEGKTLLPNIS